MIGVALSATVVISLMLAPVANADGPTTTLMRGSASPDGIQVDAFEPSPSGCTGQANYPHQSDTARPALIAKGVTQTDCRSIVPSITTAAALDRLVGGFFFQEVSSGRNTGLNSLQVKASATEPCNSGAVYAVRGMHEVTDVDGQGYAAITTSPTIRVFCG